MTESPRVLTPSNCSREAKIIAKECAFLASKSLNDVCVSAIILRACVRRASAELNISMSRLLEESRLSTYFKG